MKKTFIAIAILGFALTSCSRYDEQRIEKVVNETAKELGYEGTVQDEGTSLAEQREKEEQLVSDEPAKCAWCGHEGVQREMEYDNGNDFCSRKCLVEYQKNEY